MSGTGTPIPGFISYAHDDDQKGRLYPPLRQQLKILAHQRNIAFWDDNNLRAGHVWRNEIADAIERARVFILPVSSAWLASDYIQNDELPAIFERFRQGALVCPVILQRCPWQPLLEGPPDTSEALLSAAKVLTRAAENALLIDADTISDIDSRIAMARRGGAQGRKQCGFVVAGMRNMLLKAGAIAAGHILGGLGAGDHNEKTLLAAIKQTLHRAGQDVARTLLPSAEAVRDAFGRLIEEAGKPNDAFEAPPPAGDGPDGDPGFPIPEMVTIPPGSFRMGVPDAESQREDQDDSNARPEHDVTIGYSFRMGKYPVTRGQFAAFVADAGYDAGTRWRDLGFPQEDDHPVVCVSFDDALAYIAWLNRRTRGSFRLPSEAEWEYAARAGTTTARYWGDAWNADAAKFAWCAGNSRGTAPAGERQPNDFGLHDMLGNVWEWCADPWHDKYDDAPDDGSVWNENGNDGQCVLRGGSWYEFPGNIRAGVCYFFNRGYRINDVGFRLSRTLYL